jgi:putative redox protein
MADTHATTLTWMGDMAFEAEVQGHRMMLDAAAEHGGKNRGPRPKPLLLSALAGCTGMDVVSILKKMRVPFDAFHVEVRGELTDEHPKTYRRMHIVYRVRGDNIDRSKVERAVEMSRTSYCAVSAMLQRAAEITHEIVIET